VNQHYKKFVAGGLFKFVYAPPRPGFKEEPREPSGLLDKIGTVLNGPHEDSHDWGGLFEVLVEGQIFQYYGDFMESF
jgi:hypothetical protein